MPPPVTIYDGTGHDRLSLYAWQVMFRELHDFRELIFRLVVRDFSAQFRQSFLGYLWVVFPPLATTLIFTLLRLAEIVNIPMEGDIPYLLFALTGVTIWGMFTQFVLAATTSIARSGNLVSKIYFPREVLVISGAGGALINSAIQWVMVVITFVIVCFAMGFVPAWQVVFVPVLFVPMILLALGLGLFFAPINTMMHDTSRALQFIFQFGMFMAPTVYQTPTLYTRELGEYAPGLATQFIFWVHLLNPVSHTLYAVHELIEFGRFTPTAGWQAATLLSVLVFALGWRFFHVCEPLLAERL